MTPLKIAIIIIRLALGGLFIYAGIQKFIPKPPKPQSEATVELPPNVVTIKAYIGGLKQTGYFWPMLGVAELAAGILLVSQYLSLLGAVLLLPVTFNIFMFHLFLKPNDVPDLLMSVLYLLGNLAIIGWYYPKFKNVLLNFKTIY